MIYLIAFFAPLLPVLLWECFRCLYLHFKQKEKLPLKSLAIEKAIDLTPVVLFSLLIALLIDKLSGGYRPLDVFGLFLAFGLLPFFLRASRIVPLLKKETHPNWRWLIVGSVSFVYLILECFAFNARAYHDFGEGEEINGASFSSLRYSYSSNGDRYYSAEANESSNVTISKNSNSNLFYVQLDGKAAENLYFTFDENTPTSQLKVSFWTLKDGADFHWDSSWDFRGASYLNPRMLDSCYLAFPETDSSALKILFELDPGRYNSPSSVSLLSIKTNQKLPFSFSLVRFGLVHALLFTLAYFPEIFLRHRQGEITRKPYLVLIGAGIVSSLIVLIVGSSLPDLFSTPYSYIRENAGSPNYSLITIYDRLVDAINNGRLNLDGYLDERLLTMSNPYDRDARSALGINALWDHAYYKGNYYCYYGIAPALLFLYPYFLLSGKTLVPNVLFASLFGMCYLVPVYLILLLEITRLARGKIDWPVFIFLSFVSVLCSTLLNNITYKDAFFHEGIYHLPILYGILLMDLFLLFVLLAYRKAKARPYLLALAGLSFAFMIASRPTLFLSVFLASPFLLGMLLEKGRDWKHKTLDFVPMGAILLVGAVLICLYNYKRFDSIFEFGQSYQINYDQTHLTYGINKLFPSLVHFLFTPPYPQSSFPFFDGSVIKLSFDDLPYNNSYLGVFFTGWLVLAFAAPFLLKGKENRLKRAFLSMAPIIALFLMFTTYSKAGICLRYTLEIFNILSLGAFYAAWLLYDRPTKKSEESASMNIGFAPFLYALGLYGAFVGFALIFNVFDGIARGDFNGLYFYLEEAFGNYNCLPF